LGPGRRHRRGHRGHNPSRGIVLSSFTGSEDHDGTKIQGLADPSPVDADLSAGQIDAMLRKAISLGTTRRGGLASIVASDDWVVIKPRIQTDPYLRGSVTDLRVVRSLIEFLVEHKCGARFTIAEGPESKAAADGWTSYDNMIRELSRKYPKLAFDRVDLNFDEAIELPLRGKALAYFIPKTIQQCDRIISVAPLATSERTGVSLSVANYWVSHPEPISNSANPMRCWWTCSATIRPTTPSSAAHGASRAAGNPFITTCWWPAPTPYRSMPSARPSWGSSHPSGAPGAGPTRGFGSADLGQSGCAETKSSKPGPYALGAYFSRIRNK